MADSAALLQLRRLEPDLADLAARAPGAEVRDCGPFRALVSRSTGWANLVMPLTMPGSAAAVAAAVAELRGWFAERECTPRFLFKEPFFPGLAPMLEAAGLVLSEREPLLICTPVTFRPLLNADVSVRFLHATAPDADLTAFQTIFDESLGDGTWAPAPEALAAFRAELDGEGCGATLATLAGRPVGTGFVAMHGAGCEVMRIATRPADRRRGVGATVTSVLVREGFNRGAGLAWLTAATPEARVLYERLGFEYVGDELTYLPAG